MGLSATYSVDNIVDAISNADTYIYTAAVTGNYAIVDMVIDAQFAVLQANLSGQELQVVNHRFKLGLTQDDASAVLGISQPRICQVEANIRRKLSKVLSEWKVTE